MGPAASGSSGFFLLSTSNEKMKALSIENFKQAITGNTIILDVRLAGIFTRCFVPGSVNIEYNEKFSERVAGLFPPGIALLLITEVGEEKTTEQVLLKSGFFNITGFLDGGIDAWVNAGEPKDMIIDVEADELMMDIPFDKNLVVLDVRQETEYAGGHLKNAINIPVQELTDPGSMANFEDVHNIYVHCGGGSRSITAASLLKRQGYHNLRYVAGGWEKIKKQEKADIVKKTKALN